MIENRSLFLKNLQDRGLELATGRHSRNNHTLLLVHWFVVIMLRVLRL